MLAALLLVSKEPAAAASCYKRLVSLQPENSIAHLQLLLSYEMAGNHAAIPGPALEGAKRFKTPAFEQILLRTLMRLGREGMAHARLGTALQLYPDSDVIHRQAALIFLARKNRKASLKHARRALQLRNCEDNQKLLEKLHRLVRD